MLKSSQLVPFLLSLSFRWWIHKINVSWQLLLLACCKMLAVTCQEAASNDLPTSNKHTLIEIVVQVRSLPIRKAWLEINWLELHANKHAILERHLSLSLSLSLSLRWFQRTLVVAISGKFLNANFNIQWFCIAACFCDLNCSCSFMKSKSAFCLSLSDTLLAVADVLSR